MQQEVVAIALTAVDGNLFREMKIRGRSCLPRIWLMKRFRDLCIGGIDCGGLSCRGHQDSLSMNEELSPGRQDDRPRANSIDIWIIVTQNMLRLNRKSSSQHQPDYALDRLRVEQIVVSERYCRDSAQWQKLRAFWHPDDSRTSVKITWFNETIEGHIAASKDMAERGGLVNVKHFIHPVDVTSSPAILSLLYGILIVG